MGNSVTFGPGQIIGEKQDNGSTSYEWAFPVVINGQAGVLTGWSDTNNQADAAAAAQQWLDQQLNDNPAYGDYPENIPGFEGVASNDTDNQDGNRDDGNRDDDGRDDDDGAYASNDGGDDWGDSV